MEFRRENSFRRWDVRPRVFTELELELRARNDQESINFPGICKHIGKNIKLPIEYGIKEIMRLGTNNTQVMSSAELRSL